MKLNNKGFALTSVIYLLIVLFLMMMLLILANLAQRKVVLDKIKTEVKEKLNQGGVSAQKIYTVTFDPNGGTLLQNTKQVSYNEQYGELPIPTREGYTFKGWRGKNMFDEETILMAIDGATHENGYYNFFANNAHKLYGAKLENGIFNYVGTSNINIVFKENTNYTISIKGYTDYYETGQVYESLFIFFIYNDGTRTVDVVSGNMEKTHIIKNDINKTIEHVGLSYGRGNVDSHISYVQLEEGDTATEYEPYQIYTNDTIVTKQENHTLYAVWEANE